MINFVGIHGVARSGKDTAAQALVDIGYTRVAFADILRKGLYALNPIAQVDSVGRIYRVQDIVDELGWDEAKSIGDVRALLQRMGTEAGREIHGEDVWVDLAFRALDPEGHYVFTDVRFPNEAGKFIRMSPFKSLLLKVNRPGVTSVNEHVSDAGLPDDWFDTLVENDGTIEELHTKMLDLVGYSPETPSADDQG
jgi:hypothetical protein